MKNVHRLAQRCTSAGDAVLAGHFAAVIAEDRIVGPDRLGELLVLLRLVDAGGEVRHVELPELRPVLRHHFALGGAAGRERPWKPRQHHRLFAVIVRELIRLAVAAGQAEIGGQIAHLQFFRRCHAEHDRTSCQMMVTPTIQIASWNSLRRVPVSNLLELYAASDSAGKSTGIGGNLAVGHLQRRRHRLFDDEFRSLQRSAIIPIVSTPVPLIRSFFKS